MTSAIFSRTVSGRRAGLAAAGLVGALVLTACSGGGSDDDASPSSSASAPPSASPSAAASSSGTSSSASGEVAGSWLTTTGGKAVALLVNGDRAGLFATGGTVCSGSASAKTIRLKCADGSTDRAEGTVESVGKTELKVRWSGAAGTETYTRAEGGRLPSGLPTAGLGS
ncbi:hypothetical protein [Streptomyces sp. NRRL B-24085]|uniref:hypothetical protein n=1 Tax=Streptomyces sp. NRRL B-24085 TaxID=1709476 RepID=UPI0006B38B52|nr:hypothetical protein [Streptomyces sp. NRRL B-24085]